MAGGAFSVWDWVVFVVILVMVLGTGVFMGMVSRRKVNEATVKNTTSEYLTGGRKLHPLAVSLSTVVGNSSSVVVLGNAAEMYGYGTQMWMNLIGIALGFVMVHLINLKVFYPLKVTSIITYIEMRFQSRALRTFCIYCVFCSLFLFMGLNIYTPSLAMQTVTGLPPWASIIIMSVISTIYSSWGGVRAVVYTDILLACVMMSGVVVIIVTATMEVGGIGNMWDIAWKHNRVELWNLDPDPLQRHSLWLVICQGYFLALFVFGSAQACIQRVCSVSTWKKAVCAHYLSFCSLATLFCCVNLMGIAVYAVYANCDPVATGEVQKIDQIVPFYVIDRLSGLYGVPGLFVASLYAGGLSAYSTRISAINSIVWEDILKGTAWVASVREERRRYITTLTSVIVGIVGVGWALLFTLIDEGVFQAAQTITGAVNSPIFGVFLLGMCFPFVNELGGAMGLGITCAFNLWIAIGSLVYGSAPQTLEFSDEGCNSSTSTFSSLPSTSFSTEFPPSSSSPYSTSFSALPSSASSIFSSSSSFPSSPEDPEDPYIFPLYRLSYTLYGLIGTSLCVFVGVVTSLLYKPWTTEKAGERYLHPTFSAIQKWWERRHPPKELPTNSTLNLVHLEKF